MVLTVISILAFIGVRIYSYFIDSARNTRAIAEIRLIEKEIIGFWNANERLPDSLAALGGEIILDPWKRPYQFINFDTTSDAEEKRRTKGNPGRGRGRGSPLNSDYDLFSMGKDRMSAPPLTDDISKDDIVRADDGVYTGLASEY